MPRTGIEPATKRLGGSTVQMADVAFPGPQARGLSGGWWSREYGEWNPPQPSNRCVDSVNTFYSGLAWTASYWAVLPRWFRYFRLFPGAMVWFESHLGHFITAGQGRI